MTANEFRAMALAFPGAMEAAHMNHPDFRSAGRIFASLGAPDEAWGMVKLAPEQQRSFILAAPGAFKPCNGAWGLRGATYVHLASAKKKLVQEALTAAWDNVASTTRTKKKSAKRGPKNGCSDKSNDNGDNVPRRDTDSPGPQSRGQS